MKPLRLLFLLLLGIQPLPADPTPSVYPALIEVIANDAIKITGGSWLKKHPVPVKIYSLDAPARVFDQLEQDLPNTEEAAKQHVLQKLNAEGQTAFKTRLSEAFQGVIKSTEYGIDRYPAMVFDGGKSVIYGITDLDVALARYQAFKQNAAASQAAAP